MTAELRARRALLTTTANPEPGLDYLVTAHGQVDTANGPAEVRLRWVPGRWILDPAGLDTWLAALADGPWTTVEALASVMLDDINNEAVPRWLEVTVTSTRTIGSLTHHAVRLEDRQPDWDNPTLLNHILRL